MALSFFATVVVLSQLVFSVFVVSASDEDFNVTVSQDGTGDFDRIADAISQAPTLSEYRYTIRIKQGVYDETLEIPSSKTNLMLVGDGANRTRITGSHSNGSGYSTYDSATVAVKGAGFVAKNIAFENSAPWTEGTAVALLNEADRSAFYQCTIQGYQDTLYARKGYQFYRECDIYGTVDFIFGYASAVFQNCNLYAHLPNRTITYTAQSKVSDQHSGFIIQNCTLTLAPGMDRINSSVQAFMGRPWSDYSTVVVMESWLDSIIDPKGWGQWDKPLDKLTYREYNNRGPGSDTGARVRWPGFSVIEKRSDAKAFTSTKFLNGESWLPQTGIPFYGGFAESVIPHVHKNHE